MDQLVINFNFYHQKPVLKLLKNEKNSASYPRPVLFYVGRLEWTSALYTRPREIP